MRTANERYQKGGRADGAHWCAPSRGQYRHNPTMRPAGERRLSHARGGIARGMAGVARHRAAPYVSWQAVSAESSQMACERSLQRNALLPRGSPIPQRRAPRGARVRTLYGVRSTASLEHDAAICLGHFRKFGARQKRGHPGDRLETAPARKLALAPGFADRLRAAANFTRTWIGHLPLCTAQSTYHSFASLCLPLTRSRRSKDRSSTIRKAHERQLFRPCLRWPTVGRTTVPMKRDWQSRSLRTRPDTHLYGSGKESDR